MIRLCQSERNFEHYGNNFATLRKVLQTNFFFQHVASGKQTEMLSEDTYMEMYMLAN